MEHDLNILMIFGIKENWIILTHTMYCCLLLQIYLCYLWLLLCSRVTYNNTLTSAHEAVGGDGWCWESSDRRDHDSHENDGTGQSCRNTTQHNQCLVLHPIRFSAAGQISYRCPPDPRSTTSGWTASLPRCSACIVSAHKHHQKQLYYDYIHKEFDFPG